MVVGVLGAAVPTMGVTSLLMPSRSFFAYWGVLYHPACRGNRPGKTLLPLGLVSHEDPTGHSFTTMVVTFG